MFIYIITSIKTKKSHDNINEMYDIAIKKSDNIEKQFIKIEKK